MKLNPFSNSAAVLIGVALSGVVGVACAQDSRDTSPWPWVVTTGSENAITLLLMGDTNIQQREDPASAYQNVLPTLRAADIRFANLEGPLSGTSSNPLLPDIEHKTGWTHSEPEMVEALIAAGLDGVGVANNVTYPYDVMLRSLAVLDEANIGYTGGGNDIGDAHRPLILTRDGIRFGFLQYTALYWPYDHAATLEAPGVASVKIYTSYRPPADVLHKPGARPIIVTSADRAARELMLADIRALSESVDIVIASYHWGVSGQSRIDDYQRDIARAAVEAGADIVMGHGPHVLQPIEVWQGKPIFYSLANFAFDWWFLRDRNKDGLLVRAVIGDGQLARVSAVPVTRDAEDNNPVLLDPNSGEGQRMFLELVQLSGAADAPLRIEGKEIVISLAGKDET
jgi:poly-gamma-glutamate synthesis protein (capsule biosynthesis protein)